MLIVDAGPLFAAAAVDEDNHERCRDLLENGPRPLVVPTLVVVEVSYLLAKRLGPGAELAFGRAIADGELMVEPVDPIDWDRIADLMEKYRDLPLGMVDASVIALAERLQAREIATLDHRHFATIRPRHVQAFSLLP